VKNCLSFLILILLATAATAQARHKKDITANGQNADTPVSPIAAKSSANDSAGQKAFASPLDYRASPDSVIRIGLILPFDAQNATDRLNATMSNNEQAKSESNKLKEASKDAIDFYEGLQFALSTDTSRQKISFFTFDSENNDSIVEELLNNAVLRTCDLIIGPTNAAQAKVVSAFCKKNKIINIQPFVASKSFSSDNDYLVRFVPTIDAHLQQEYEMVTDSFSNDNIIIYTTKKERDLAAARQLDTLFKAYNAINPHKIKYAMVNSGDSSMPAANRSLSAYIKTGSRNVVMMTCYDEPVVNSQLRTVKENTIVFGMPTWLDAEQIRADYLSKAQPYITDNYYVDTAKKAVTDFISSYTAANGQPPSRYSYLGYDAMRYLSIIFSKYGKAFKLGFDNESYDGLGFSFHISPVIHIAGNGTEATINYYTNTAMHLFQVSDYKVWLVR
jgi:ABC-type branched-subunit amino acid transport system substrate-binding protein